LHFAIFYSQNPGYSVSDYGVIPVDGYFMDPNSFYRQQPPYDSPSVKALSDSDKRISIPYLNQQGRVVPAGSLRVWPYRCSAKS